MAVPGMPRRMISISCASEDARRNCPCSRSTPGTTSPSGPWQFAQAFMKRRSPSCASAGEYAGVCAAAAVASIAAATIASVLADFVIMRARDLEHILEADVSLVALVRHDGFAVHDRERHAERPRRYPGVGIVDGHCPLDFVRGDARKTFDQLERVR